MRRVLTLIVALLTLATTAQAQTYTVTPTPFQTAFDNSGRIINGACVWTYTAGTTTAATTYTTSTGTANSNPIQADSAGRFTAFLSPGSSYKFVYETACTPPAHGSVLRTADNIAATPSSAASVDITGTAGESITAGQCAYLSNGDGSKTQGLWYKCDSGAFYSAFAKSIGLATVNIASSATGTIRIEGVVTGLTALSASADYYVGTAGALTATAPTNARRIGQALSATSLLVTANPPPTMVGGTTPFFGFVDDFRLSLTTATCVTTSDVTAATTLYLTPCTGNRLTLFNTSGVPETCTTAEISIAVPASTSQMYDIWAYDSTFGTCTVTLELLAWTNDTTRATATARTNGRWTKSGDATRLYLGSFRTTTVSGQTEASATKQYVWNQYNRAGRVLNRNETNANWAYSNVALHQANASALNQVDVVIGQQEVRLSLTVIGLSRDTNNSIPTSVAIGEDSTTVAVAGQLRTVSNVATNGAGAPTASLVKTPAVGRHYYAWLENSGGAATTFYNTTPPVIAGTALDVQSGISGWIEG